MHAWQAKLCSLHGCYKIEFERLCSDDISLYSLCVVYPVTSRYAQYLKSCYQEPLPDDENLLINVGKIYIELAVITNENISAEESENLMRMNIRGQTDEILLKKPP